jgi:CelD/BcsL family acetyltransferase involved in cellulose biosynthesis
LAALHPEAQLRVIQLQEGEILVALAVCYVERTRIHRLPVTAYRSFGDKLHDYTRFYAATPEALICLLEHVRQDARQCGADVVHLNHQLVPHWLDRISGHLRSATETKLFDAALAPGGWQAILDRKSLQRVWKNASKLPGYHAVTTVGTFSRRDIEALAVLHRERWRFAGVGSAFTNPRRIEEYLCHPANKVLTKAMLGEEMLGCLYGMLYDDLLLFHTPVINVKYLRLSPLKILTVETVRFCAARGLRYLDLGLGDESYKEYSANATRQAHEILMPVTLRGRMGWLLHRHGHPERVKAALTRVRDTAGRMRQALKARLRPPRWYEANGGTIAPTAAKYQVNCIESYESFVDFCRRHDLPLEKSHYERFKENAFFVALQDESKVFSYGWCRYCENCPSPGRNGVSSARGQLVLFAYHEPQAREEAGKNGALVELLKTLARKFSVETIATFLPVSATAEEESLLRAGFCHKPPPRRAAVALST